MIFAFQFLAEFLAGVFFTCAVINWSFLEGAGGGGLGTAAIGWAMFFIAAGLFEIPTGYIADRYGHKVSTLVGISALSGAMVAIPLSQSPIWLFATAFLAGVSLTLVSGAKTAWLYDLRGDAHDGGGFLLRLELVRRGALITAAVVGGWLTLAEPKAIWLLAGILGFIAAAVGWRLPGSQAPLGGASESPRVSLRSILETLRHSHALRRFYLASAVFALGFGVHDILLQPHVLDLAQQEGSAALTEGALGIVFGGMHTAAFIGGLIVTRWGGGSRSSLGLSLTCMLLSCGFAAAIVFEAFWPFVVSWSLAYGAMSWFYPLRAFFILEQVPKHSSATFLSADEALDGIVRGILALAIGLSLSKVPADSIWLGGIAALLIAAVLWRTPLIQSRRG